MSIWVPKRQIQPRWILHFLVLPVHELGKSKLLRYLALLGARKYFENYVDCILFQWRPFSDPMKVAYNTIQDWLDVSQVSISFQQMKLTYKTKSILAVQSRQHLMRCIFSATMSVSDQNLVSAVFNTCYAKTNPTHFPWIHKGLRIWKLSRKVTVL